MTWHSGGLSVQMVGMCTRSNSIDMTPILSGCGVLNLCLWLLPGYFALGDIANACEWCGWPKPLPYLGRIRCLSEEMVEPCSVVNTPLWTNEGGFENERGSVWTIRPNRGVSTFWLGNKGWDDAPQNGIAYCLKEVEFEPDA